MTDVVIPPTIDALPPAPLPSDSPAEFDAKAFALLAAQQSMVGQMNGSASATMTNADIAKVSADAAVSSAFAAAASQEIALAATAFKGLWSTLTGPLERPASVKHNGRFWLLLNDLANVAASQPGVSADWTSMDTGTVAQDVNTNTTMLPGVVYAVKTLGITLSLPDTIAPGDKFAAVDASGGGFYINWKTRTVRGKTPESPMRVPAARGVDVTFTGSTLV